MHEANYLPLLTISVLALVVPILTARLARIRQIKIPTMIGEIAAGIIIGRSGFNLITPDEWVNFLSTFGFGYLMFLSGLELDFDVMLGRKKPEQGEQKNVLASHPLVLAFLFFLSALALGYLASRTLVRWGYLNEPWLVTLVMVTISLGIVVPTLKEQNYEKTPFGQNLIVVSSIADFGSILGLTLLASLSTGEDASQLLLGLGLIVAMVLFYRLGQALRHKEVTKGLPPATSQMGVRFSFAVIFIFMSIAQSAGIEAILGSFLAGTLISMLFAHDKVELQEKLEAIGYGFFIPAFFIMVGVDFDFWALFRSPQALRLVPILLVLSFVVKMIPAFWYKTAFSWKQTFAAGALLSAQLSFTIAAAAIGLRVGLISEAVHAALILIALLTSVLSPLFFNRIIPKANQAQPKIVLLGTFRRIQALSASLETGKMPVETFEVPKEQKPTMDDLAPLKIDEATKVIIAAEGDDDNYNLAELVTKHFSPADTLVIGKEAPGVKALGKLGVRSVTPTSALIMLVNHLINHPAAFNLLYDETHSAVHEVHLTPGCPAVGKAVKDLRLPPDTLILTIVREGHQHIVPRGNTVLEPNDVLFIIGRNEEAAGEVNRCLIGKDT